MSRRALISAAVGTGAYLILRRPAYGATLRFSRKYDSVLRANCHGVPVAYLRSLAKHESDFNPNNTNGPAWGLLQVVEVVRESYNKRFGTRYTRQDLLNPNINAKIACELISRISRTLPRNHPKMISRDWNSRKFAEIVTFAWNAGYSEASGVGYVLGEMERKGIGRTSVSIDSIHSFAKNSPKASGNLRNSSKVSWSKRVAADYIA